MVIPSSLGAFPVSLIWIFSWPSQPSTGATHPVRAISECFMGLTLYPRALKTSAIWVSVPRQLVYEPSESVLETIKPVSLPPQASIQSLPAGIWALQACSWAIPAMLRASHLVTGPSKEGSGRLNQYQGHPCIFRTTYSLSAPHNHFRGQSNKF